MYRNSENVLNFENKEIQSSQALEEDLLKLFDASCDGSRDVSYKDGTRYRLTDHNGDVRTFSKHVNYRRIKYHFERRVQ